MESQISPTVAPVILWLNGGPGCSSLEGLLLELGPFHVHDFGNVVYENVYSWNKVSVIRITYFVFLMHSWRDVILGISPIVKPVSPRMRNKNE